MANVIETEVEGGGYEQRYSIWLGSCEMKMVRRPVSITPPDGTVCFVDDGPRTGRVNRHTAGVFKGGKWSRVRFEPTHWTHWDDLKGGSGGGK